MQSLSLSNGQRSVLIAAEMQPGYQVDRYGAAVRSVPRGLPRRARQMTESSIETSFDQAGYTSRASAKRG